MIKAYVTALNMILTVCSVSAMDYQPPFPRPPVRPDGCSRGLPSEENS